jgi:hypothetical protein
MLSKYRHTTRSREVNVRIKRLQELSNRNIFDDLSFLKASNALRDLDSILV